MATKKLTKAEKQVAADMLGVIEWASDHPKRWHVIGKLESTRRAAELLEKRGVIEIWPETNQYRVKSAGLFKGKVNK
jgi:hypothetical protein